MNWQKEKPTKAGWYVTKGTDESHAQYYIVEVYREGKNLVAKGQGYRTATTLSQIKNTEFEWLLLEEV